MIDKINQLTYSELSVVSFYEDVNSLQIPEQVILNKIEKEVRGKPILDIGVGCGRTINHLTKLSSLYAGIDYSKQMIEACEKMYPQVNLLNLDARDLSIFPDESFFFVLFSFNGIDCVSHSDRIKILTEIHRVLQKGGYFVFSSHNRASFNPNSKKFRIFRLPEFSSILDTVSRYLLSGRLLSLCPKIVIRMYNRLKYRKFEIHEQEYSIINDSAHNYSCLHYYISISKQLAQLVHIGFSEKIEAYNRKGQIIMTDSLDPWIYYLARKETSYVNLNQSAV